MKRERERERERAKSGNGFLPSISFKVLDWSVYRYMMDDEIQFLLCIQSFKLCGTF